MKVPEYWLNQEHVVPSLDHLKRRTYLPLGAEVVLEQRSYIKPIWNKQFVPKDLLNRWIVDKNDVFCYTSFGIIPIPRSKIEESFE